MLIVTKSGKDGACVEHTPSHEDLKHLPRRLLEDAGQVTEHRGESGASWSQSKALQWKCTWRGAGSQVEAPPFPAGPGPGDS